MMLGPHTEVEIETPWERHARWLLALLSISSTALATWWYFRLITGEGVSWFELLLTGLFIILFQWIAFSFWTATLGYLAVATQPQPSSRRKKVRAARQNFLPRTALLMPIYNENPDSVIAGVRAMLQSLQAHGSANLFDLYLLSDSTDPEVWLKEEQAWAKLVTENNSDVRVYYRHRAKNLARKSGNIADFCTRWGQHYRYMIVLDADSVMAGDTLVEMVSRMEDDPEIGILQVPPLPVGRNSFFARIQQFAARLYSPVFLKGFMLWSRCDGNYWGHNAIIRIEPFMEHCDLPVLSGEAPLGGEILSHDFVEAALIRRAGWKVCIAQDLDGSYEECPTTLLDYAQRDRRWCQGNLQHTRLLLAEGIHPVSRIHLAMGVMSYLSSPLWLLFLLLTVVQALLSEGTTPLASSYAGLALFLITISMLLLPKLYSLLALRRQPLQLKQQGGGSKVISSVLIETFVSALLAPILMLLQSSFVFFTLLGQNVGWNAQSRDDGGIRLQDAIRVHYLHTLFGLVLGLFFWFWLPGLFWWMVPVLAGPLLSIPISLIVGNVSLGKQMAKWKLLLIPEEVAEPELLLYKRQALKQTGSKKMGSKTGSLFDAVLFDPASYALHTGILRATKCGLRIAAKDIAKVKQILRSSGSDGLSQETCRYLLNDADALQSLHIFARSRL